MDIDVLLENKIVSLNFLFIVFFRCLDFDNGSQKLSEVDPLYKMYYFLSPVTEG